MIRRYTFKLHPNAEQSAAMFETRYLVCQLYNALVEQRRDAWDRCRKSLTAFDQGKECTLLRQSDDRYKALGSAIMERCAERVDQAFKKYFDNVKLWRRGQWSKLRPPSPPRYQRTRDFSGFGYREEPKGWKFADDRVRLKSIPGMVRMSGRFPVDPVSIRTCDVMWRDENWWISIVVNLPDEAAMRAATGRFLNGLPSNFPYITKVNGNIGCGDPSAEGEAQVVIVGGAIRSSCGDPSAEGEAQELATPLRSSGSCGDPSAEGEAQVPAARSALSIGCGDPSVAEIRIDAISHFATLTDARGTYRIDLPPAKAAKGPRGARNRVRRQAKAIRRRDYALHELTSAIAALYRDVTVIRPDTKAVTASAAGDKRQHGAMVKWKAGVNRDILDYGAGKFCELLTYKVEQLGGKIEIQTDAEHLAQLPVRIAALAKSAKQARRVAKRASKGAMRAPTQRNFSAVASNHPDQSRASVPIGCGSPPNVG